MSLRKNLLNLQKTGSDFLKRKPIGIFDSGLGGLTTVKELSKLLPNEDIIYFGDTGRVPYGTRSEDTIIKYVRQDMNFLKANDVKMIIAACGTASSVALKHLTDEFDVPVIGVLEPACKAAALSTKNNKIGVLATPGTINSGAYGKGIRNLDKSIIVYEKACPMFVPLVENGYINSEPTRIIAREYLEPMMEDEVDTIILGCTHYPLLTGVINEITNGKINLINVGYETAKYAKDLLKIFDILNDKKENGTEKYYVSDDVEKFSYLGGMFLERTINSTVKKIDIEKY